MYIYTYTLLYEKTYTLRFGFALNFRRALSSMTSINSGFFWAEKFLAPQIPVKLEVKSHFSKYIKNVSFDLLLRD